MYNLVVVMPVYNEEECIAAVVREWMAELNLLKIDYQVVVLNDGSKDRSEEVLSFFSGDPHIQIINKPNTGHGPTILQGYRMASEEAEWVFQCDSDGEMPAVAFPSLWEKREQYDALFGYRQHRAQSKGRALISAVSRIAVHILFGRGVVDVNTPYRLMRGALLRKILPDIQADTFAPNIILTGELIRRKVRVLEVPVSTKPRLTGRCSIIKWSLFRAAARSFYQTIRYFVRHPVRVV